MIGALVYLVVAMGSPTLSGLTVFTRHSTRRILRTMGVKPESNEHARGIASSRQLWVPIAVLSVVALGLIALWFFRPPPLGNCFGGLLNQDPLHCYALEQTQKRGLINIEKIYDADGVLYLFLRQEGSVDDEVYEFLKAMSYEFYDRWPDDVPRNPFYSRCTNRGYTYRECYLDERRWRARAMLPRSMVYENLLFHVGGETARRLEPGWAGWRQVWPRGLTGVDDGTPSTFDVSDVNSTNVPVSVCPEKVAPEEVYSANICSRDREVAHSVVARHGQYVQYKNPPKDEAALNAIKETILPCYNKVGPCTWYATTTVTRIVDGVETDVTERVEVYSERNSASEMVIIPVKYSPIELARWAEILDRFAHSRGNTIGIMGAEVDTNRRRRSGYSGSVVWPLDHLGPAEAHESGGTDRSTVRETIQVWGGDAQRIADALPVLLPLLGIPVDAVGLVTTSWRGGISYTW